MANTLPTTIEYFDNLLGEQLTGGGGGSSDFSTAQVSVENNTEEFIDGTYVRVDDTPLSAVVPMNTLSVGSRTYIVPLYKGTCSWTINGLADVSVSGDIEWDSGNRRAFIKGDCTIHLIALK